LGTDRKKKRSDGRHVPLLAAAKYWTLKISSDTGMLFNFSKQFRADKITAFYESCPMPYKRSIFCSQITYQGWRRARLYVITASESGHGYRHQTRHPCTLAPQQEGDTLIGHWKYPNFAIALGAPTLGHVGDIGASSVYMNGVTGGPS